MRTVREAAEAAVLQPHWVKQFGRRFLQDLVTDVAAEIEADRESVREACAKKADGIGCNSCCGLNDGAETIREVDIKGKPAADRLRRVWRNPDGSMSFAMGAHCCVALCPCQLKPGESQPLIASMDDFNAYAAVYPPREGEHSTDWQHRIVREGRRTDAEGRRSADG